MGYTVAGHTVYPDHFRFLSLVTSPEKQEQVKRLRLLAKEQFSHSELVEERLEYTSPILHNADDVKDEGRRIEQMKATGQSKAAIKRAQQETGVVAFSAVRCA